MRQLIIDKRLRLIINEIEGDTLIDCGCDHGKVAIQSMIENRVNKVIATDISQKSLDKCVALSKKMNIKNIEFRCGDGLDVINDNEADVLCIAGMGGREIVKILSNIKAGINKVILCPHQDIELLRQSIKDNWKITKDVAIFVDDHFYNLICAYPGVSKLGEKEILLGMDSKDNEDYVLLLKFLKGKYEKILSNTLPDNRCKECENYLKIIEGELSGSKKDI
mgnify:CR=1 FL=1